MIETAHIRIAYATANDYEYTVVSMYSVLKHADLKTVFDFYILVDNDFCGRSRDCLRKCLEPYKDRCHIIFLNVGDIFNNVQLKIDFINRPTYFRLLLPDLLPEDRCIYLDSDTIVCTGLEELFEVEMKKNYIAGVKAPWYVLKAPKESYCRQALLPDLRQYVNAGVLVMNLKQMREDHVVKKFLELLPLNMDSQDQDILNSVCYNKIHFLACKYNVMTKYAMWKVPDYDGLFSEKELKDAWNNPGIIHYADREKPWRNLSCAMAAYWWNICRNSAVWNLFLTRMSEFFFNRAIYCTDVKKGDISTNSAFALFDLAYKKNIVIYGAGNRAVKLIQYLRGRGVVPEYILVSDKTKNPHTLEGIQVNEPNDITEEWKDKTIVIATLEKYHQEIISDLLSYEFKEMIPLNDLWEE
ncbi:MAG: glycosyltransferase family 8 protein [Lachnospiraceae bacterium]|jgi:lipopolysaccharide biosynthesis glycosyltransferase|nr:glycosyltransferase family 8 protein [Lachnospiraceae bacterium]